MRTSSSATARRSRARCGSRGRGRSGRTGGSPAEGVPGATAAALRGPLNYSRAPLRPPKDLSGPPQAIPMPTLLIWGQRDPYLSVRLTEGLGRWVADLRVERLADASH